MAGRAVAIEGLTSSSTNQGPSIKSNPYALRLSSVISSKGRDPSFGLNVASTAWVISEGDREKLLGHLETHRARNT